MTTLIATFTNAQAGDLTVTISGVKEPLGIIGCALFNKEAGFTKRSSAIALSGEKASPAGNSCVFKGLADGTYAVAVLHDTNGNQKMDFSALGLPAEDWGMSNNVRPSFRGPTFKEASVKLSFPSLSESDVCCVDDWREEIFEDCVVFCFHVDIGHHTGDDLVLVSKRVRSIEADAE
eukprot:gene2145-3047_t